MNMRLHTLLVVIGVLCLGGLGGCDRLRSAETIVSRGEQQYQKGNYRAALGDFKTALEKDVNNLTARSYLARISYHLADFEAAQHELDIATAGGARDLDLLPLKYQILLARQQYDEVLKAIDSESSLTEVQRLLYTGQAKAALGQVNDALVAYDRALSITPNDTSTLVAQATLLASMGETARASAVVDTVLKQDQNHAMAWFMRGGLLVAKGDLTEAKTALEKAQKLGQQQLNWAEQARLLATLADVGLRMRDVETTARWITALDGRAPQSPVAFYLKARLALLNNNANDALAQLQKATQQGDYLPAGLLLANVLMMQSSFGQAEEQLNKLRNDHPDNPEVSKLLAQLYLSTKRPDEARKILPQAEQAAGVVDAQMDWLRGQTLLATGSTDVGVAMLEKSVASAPGDAPRSLQLARMYIAAGQRDKALVLLNSLPADAGGSQRQSMLMLASVMGKRIVDARRDIDALLARYPEDSSLHAAAGTIFLQAGDAQAALPLLSKAVTLDGKNLDARLALAALYLRANQHDQAEQQLNAVLAQDTKRTLARIGLASVALAKGNRTQAAKQLEQAIGADPAAVEPRMQLAQLAIADKDMPRATALLQQAVTASKDAPTVLNSAGQVLFQAKSYEEALAYFEQATASGLKVARINAALVNLALGQNVTARQKLEAAASDAETRLQATAILVEHEVREGKLDAALQRIERLREAKVPAQIVDELSGDAYAMASQLDTALIRYERAAKVEASQRLVIKQFRTRVAGKMPNSMTPLNVWLATHPGDIAVRRLLAQQLLLSDDHATAAREFERVLADSATRNPAELNNLAWLYQQLKDSRAEATAREAYQVGGDEPAIADTYGWILVNAGKVAEALPILQKAAAVAKTDLEIQYHLAAAQVRGGQKDQAKALLQDMLAGQQAFASRVDAERLRQSLGK